jgi:2Fe-2S ferredoxin
MELIRASGIGDIEAICGGSCACATCHVYVDDSFRDRLPRMTEDEDDLLDTSTHRGERSRLSCQLTWTEQLDGLRVEIAPAD